MAEVTGKQAFLAATDKLGGPAYPFVMPSKTDATTGAVTDVDVFPGMTLRDWFAGQVIAGIGSWTPGFQFGLTYAEGLKARSEWAYRHADAMLAARSKDEGRAA